MRKFREADIFSKAIADSNNHILQCNPQSVHKTLRAAPQYIDNPFSDNFLRGYSKPHSVSLVDEFCVQVPDAVLYGERAVVSADDFLLTDVRSVASRQVIFSESIRKFESMLPTSADGIYLSSGHIDHPEVDTNADAFLLSSSEHANYGTFLLRQLPKLIVMRSLGLTNLPVVCPGLAWQRKLLALFGVTNVIAHDRHKSYGFRKLFVPSQRSNAFFIEAGVIKLFSQFATFAASRHPHIDMPLLYVSRLAQGRKNPHYRRCLNEEELIGVLKELGFTVFEPELHSIEEQVAAFRSARFVVGPSGAGMFNTVFCRPGTDVLSIEPLPIWIWQHSNMFGSMGHRYGYVTGGAIADDPAPMQKSWQADIPVVAGRVKRVLHEMERRDTGTFRTDIG